MRESVVEDYLVSKVKQTGGETRKLKWIGRAHAPDRLVLYPGKHALVEMKRPATPDARAGQAREHERLRQAGFDVRVLATMDQVDAFVKEMTA